MARRGTKAERAALGLALAAFLAGCPDGKPKAPPPKPLEPPQAVEPTVIHFDQAWRALPKDAWPAAPPAAGAPGEPGANVAAGRPDARNPRRVYLWTLPEGAERVYLYFAADASSAPAAPFAALEVDVKKQPWQGFYDTNPRQPFRTVTAYYAPGGAAGLEPLPIVGYDLKDAPETIEDDRMFQLPPKDRLEGGGAG